MEEITETYYKADDGTRFTDENECVEYEEALEKIKALNSQLAIFNKELACATYTICKYKKIVIPSAQYAGGTGHDGYYNKCPNCGEFVGGYDRRNTSLKVDENTYACEKCGKFFIYS